MIFVDEKQLFYGFWMVLATTKVGDEEFQHTTSGAVELVEMWCNWNVPESLKVNMKFIWTAERETDDGNFVFLRIFSR